MIQKILNKFTAKYYKVFKIPRLKQEKLLRLALKEKGLNPKKMRIEVDHNLGLNYVDGVKFGIKYPDSFFKQAQKLVSSEKKYSFYFNGNFSKEGKREELLKPFMDLPKSLIITSNDGRIVKNKDKFNYDYYESFAISGFGLCPHQLNWDGDMDELWTYRFIEACFVESIPILFRKTPLSEKFTSGFTFLWDDDVLEMIKKGIEIDFEKERKKNAERAKDIFCFTDLEINQLKNIKKKQVS